MVPTWRGMGNPMKNWMPGLQSEQPPSTEAPWCPGGPLHQEGNGAWPTCDWNRLWRSPRHSRLSPTVDAGNSSPSWIHEDRSAWDKKFQAHCISFPQIVLVLETCTFQARSHCDSQRLYRNWVIRLVQWIGSLVGWELQDWVPALPVMEHCRQIA